MIIEGIIIGGVIVLLGGFGAVAVTVYRMSGVLENGLTDDMQAITRDVRSLVKEQGRGREEQARQGARIDSLYQKWGVD